MRALAIAAGALGVIALSVIALAVLLAAARVGTRSDRALHRLATAAHDPQEPTP